MKQLYDAPIGPRYLTDYIHNGVGAALAIWLPAFYIASAMAAPDITAAYIAATCSGLVLLAVFTHYEGFALDSGRFRYRQYHWILGVRIGRWQPLPVITAVTVLPFVTRHGLVIDSPWQNRHTQLISNERGWKVLLSVADSAIGIVAVKSSYKKASRQAKELADVLGLAWECTS